MEFNVDRLGRLGRARRTKTNRFPQCTLNSKRCGSTAGSSSQRLVTYGETYVASGNRKNDLVVLEKFVSLFPNETCYLKRQKTDFLNITIGECS